MILIYLHIHSLSSMSSQFCDSTLDFSDSLSITGSQTSHQCSQGSGCTRTMPEKIDRMRMPEVLSVACWHSLQCCRVLYCNEDISSIHISMLVGHRQLDPESLRPCCNLSIPVVDIWPSPLEIAHRSTHAISNLHSYSLVHLLASRRMVSYHMFPLTSQYAAQVAMG